MLISLFYLLLTNCVLFVCTQVISDPSVQIKVENDNFIETTTTTTTPGPDNRNEVCPPEKSWHSSDDIKAMIDYFYDLQSFREIISDSYVTQAQQIAEKHLNETDRFEAWIQDRPTHLKHILEELANIRKDYIEPIVNLIADEIKHYPHLEEEFEARVYRTQEYLHRLEIYDMICKYNCMETQETRKKRSIEEGYYCSSLEELRDEIISKLLKSVDETERLTHLLLSQIDTNTTERIDTVQNNLKQAALVAFGNNMYQILSLQDEYHHFRQDISDINVNSDVFSIKDMGLQIDEKLLIFSNAIEKYGDKCRNCKMDHGNLQKVMYLNLENKIKEDIPTIVDALIKVKFAEVWNEIQNDLIVRFHILNERIEQAENINDFLKKLQPVQDEVAKLTDQEKKVLEHMKTKAPQTSIKNVVNLLKESRELFRKIEENSKRILV